MEQLEQSSGRWIILIFLLRTWQSLGLFMLICHETRWMTEEWTNRNIWTCWRLCLSTQEKASNWTNSFLPVSSFIPVHGEETSLLLPESWLIHHLFCAKKWLQIPSVYEWDFSGSGRQPKQTPWVKQSQSWGRVLSCCPGEHDLLVSVNYEVRVFADLPEPLKPKGRGEWLITTEDWVHFL